MVGERQGGFSDGERCLSLELQSTSIIFFSYIRIDEEDDNATLTITQGVPCVLSMESLLESCAA
jgi:hypothetical protein